MRRRLFLAAMAAGAVEWKPPQNTKALLVLQHGRKVMEWYAPGAGPETRHYTASLAKALVGGISLRLAMTDRRIRPNDLASRYIPSWAKDPLKSKITIRHLATHTSGIEDSTIEGIEHGKEPGWKGEFWRRDPNPFLSAIRDAPVLFEPGTRSLYSNPGIAALAYAVTAALRGAPEPDIRTLLRARVMQPLGISDEEWSIGYGTTYELDGMQLHASWGGANFAPRATAKVGEWMMRASGWNYAGMPIPDRSQAPHAPGSGLGCYSNFDGVWPSLPRDAFAGAGAQQQVLLVVPSLELIMVRNGGDMRSPGEDSWSAINRLLFEPLMASMGHPARPAPVPYPKSTAIRGVKFGPVEKIVRLAPDCDNWPMTWADDDALYVSYGDGRGFEPFVQEKLSMGFARVDGGPGNPRGTNIRSSSGERKGDGRSGAKGSGMVMVDGVLYQWVRNTGNAQITWSKDHARTWEWGFKLKTSFASPAFLNFGKNYAGAPDDYVYAYSQDGDSAYGVDDSVVLCRAPRKELTNEAAWEFFAAKSWTADVAKREPVFRFAHHCQRVDAEYHPVLKRYLLLVSYGHTGGWGIFDAPNPWGPWSTAFHTEYWGLGETHGYRLPTKWISKNGRDAALVFSGLIYNGVVYDAFCVRSTQFEL